MSDPGQTGIQTDEQESGRLDPRVWRVVAVVLLGPLMTQMDSTVVNVSLSTIREELHASIQSVQWIISGYMLALALMLPLNAWLVARLGAKRLYLGCFSAFTLASVLCGTAQTMEQLISARVIQGMAGGLLAPMAQMMIARIAGKHMARVVGYSAMPILLAPILGPVVAGVILKYASWPWLFYINLPIGVLAVLLAVFLLPRDETVAEARPFDLFGFLMISPGLVALLYGLDHISGQEGVLTLASGGALIGAFIRYARRREAKALIDVRLFGNRIFSVATATQFLSSGTIFAGQMLIPLYLIAGCGIPPAKAGWMLAPMGLGMFCTYPFMGFLTEKFGCRAVSVSGVLLTIAGTFPFLWMSWNDLSPAMMIIALAARGAGQGATGIPAISAAYAAVRKDQIPLATTASNIVQRLGGPIATTFMAITISFSGSHFPASGTQVFAMPFLFLLTLQLFVLVLASRLPVRIEK